MCIAVVIGVIAILGAFFYASYSICSGVYVKAYCRKHTAEKVVALTFDDGPHPAQTHRVLDVLKEYGVPATFFVIGSRARLHPEVLERIVREGHLVGNHTDTHTSRFPLSGVGEMKEELEKCEEVLEKLTGRRPGLFRPPYGVTNPLVARAVKAGGYRVIGWSIRSLDTRTGPREKVFRRVCRKLYNGAVILLHDDRAQSEVLLRMILEHLAREGYTVKRVDELFGL